MEKNYVPTKEELYNEIIRVYKKCEKMNKIILKEESNIEISDYCLHKYGGLQKICKELNIPFTFHQRVDHKDVVQDLLRVFNEHQYLSTESYKKYGKYSVTCVKDHFDGSFNKALETLNLPINMYKNVTKKDIKDDVLEIFKDKKVSSTVYRRDGKYSQSTIDRLFGSWKGLMKEMDLPYTAHDYGFDEMLRQLNNVYEKYGCINKTLIDEECDFTYQALKYYIKDKEELCKLLNKENLFSDSLSVKANLLRRILYLLFGDENIESEKTWSWLKNDKTQKNLYVDFYIDKFNLAIEYDGIQHYKMYTSFHRTEQDFIDSCARDRLKDKLLKQHKIDLVRIPYTLKLCEKNVNNLVISNLLSKNGTKI